MANVSYFQRYTQGENVVTNNTLLLLRYFYQASPLKIGTALSELTGEDIPVGLIFQQQERGQMSIPDAHISQIPLDLYIETKTNGQLYEDQLKRHIETIEASNNEPSMKILIGLSSSRIDESLDSSISNEARDKNIVFVAITFNDIVKSLESVTEIHETQLMEILEDYRDYLRAEGLISKDDQVMSAFPCGLSLDNNKRYRLYSEPANRRSKESSDFIGMYKDKRISILGSPRAVVVGHNGPNGFTCNDEDLITQDEIQRIRMALGDRVEYVRIYLFDELHETNFVKMSKYGMRNRRDFHLGQWLNYEQKEKYTIEEVAQELIDQEWY